MITYMIGLNDWIVKIEGTSSITFPADTTDQQLLDDYHAWLAEGNTPERMIPIDAIPPFAQTPTDE